MLLCQKWGSLQSPAIAFHLIQMTIYSSSWHHCILSLQDSLNLSGSWLRLFIHHPNYPAFHSFINFCLFCPLPGRFSTVPWFFKLLDYIAHSWQRNFKNHSSNKVSRILSSRFLDFCVKWCQICLFSSAFLCCTNAHVYQNVGLWSSSWRTCFEGSDFLKILSASLQCVVLLTNREQQ